MRTPFHLRAWHSALNVALKARAITDGFPRRGYSALKAQLLDSAEGIGHSIAEGRGSESQREFNRFLDIANKSATELSAQVTLGMGYGIIPERRGRDLLSSIECTRGLIESLQRTIQADVAREEAEEKERKRLARGSKRAPKAQPSRQRKPSEEPNSAQ